MIHAWFCINSVSRRNSEGIFLVLAGSLKMIFFKKFSRPLVLLLCPPVDPSFACSLVALETRHSSPTFWTIFRAILPLVYRLFCTVSRVRRRPWACAFSTCCTDQGNAASLGDTGPTAFSEEPVVSYFSLHRAPFFSTLRKGKEGFSQVMLFLSRRIDCGCGVSGSRGQRQINMLAERAMVTEDAHCRGSGRNMASVRSADRRVTTTVVDYVWVQGGAKGERLHWGL